MLMGCGCSKALGGMRGAGLEGAYINGVLIPSTPDPVGTPVVMNPTPGENFQIQPSTVPLGTYSSSSSVCNTDGGYVWYQGQCVPASAVAALRQQQQQGTNTNPMYGPLPTSISQFTSSALSTPSAPSSSPSSTVPPTSQTPVPTVTTGFDIQSFLTTYWPYLAIAGAGLVVLSVAGK